jgi:hypothetical protein
VGGGRSVKRIEEIIGILRWIESLPQYYRIEFQFSLEIIRARLFDEIDSLARKL